MDELRLRLLGGLAIEGRTSKDVGSRKARTLLAVLAVRHGSAVSVGTLAEILWGHDQPARPQDQVGVLVSRLRGSLGAHRIVRHDAGYQLATDWLDVAELDQRSAAAAASLAAGDAVSARLGATMALDLVRGDLLPEEEGAWLEGPRTTTGRAVAGLRLLAAEAALAAGDPIGAAAAAAAGLDHDPYDEAALRVLMRAHVAVGRPASALAAYAAARHRLVEDLGVSPAPETEAVHASVLAADGTGGPAAPAGVAEALGPAGAAGPPGAGPVRPGRRSARCRRGRAPRRRPGRPRGGRLGGLLPARLPGRAAGRRGRRGPHRRGGASCQLPHAGRAGAPLVR